MKTTKLLEHFVRLRDELTTPGPSERWTAERSVMVVMLNIYRGQLAYVKARAKYALTHDEVPEKSRLFTDKTIRNLKDAAAVNRQIGRHLSELKKSGRGAVPCGKIPKGAPRRPRAASARKRGRTGRATFAAKPRS